MAEKVALLCIRLAIGALFIYSGAVKAWHTQEFAQDIQRYAIIPWPDVTLLVAVYLPWVELFSGLALISRRLYRGGLIAITALMLIFTVALYSAHARKLDIPCGCLRAERESIRKNFVALFTRDLAILAGAAVLLAAERPLRWRMGFTTPGAN